MSYVIYIRRGKGKPPLVKGEIADRFAQDASLTQVTETSWSWADPASGAGFTLTFRQEELSTEGRLNMDGEASITKLRELAQSLDAQVYGEEGENLTEAVVASKSMGPWSVAGGIVVTVLFFPFVTLFLLVRLPWLVWKFLRTTK